MKTFELIFAPRLRLGNMLGGATGTLGEMAALKATFDQVRFTEDELKQIKVTTSGPMSTYEPPTAEFGAVKVTIEDSQAQVLDRHFENSLLLAVGDVEWVTALREKLK